MAAALTADDWAHGDLKPENIVADNRGRLHLIDFDAMFLPAFAGRHSRSWARRLSSIPRARCGISTLRSTTIRRP